MVKKGRFKFAASFLAALLLFINPWSLQNLSGETMEKEIKLPPPQLKGSLSVEEALSLRRSLRECLNEPLTLKEVGQILWSSQGVTAKWGGRTAPSAGATYPLETYLVAGRIESLAPGLYYYRPDSHSLLPVLKSDLRRELSAAALGQRIVQQAPAVVVLTAVYQRTAGRYGERAARYVHMEVGHASQNIYLQAEALGLATVVIGAFRDSEVKKVLKIKEEPLYLMPVGRKKN
ncbi:MAG: SagB/ThcOx family dehydrogenase [Candidatus Omnitrophota bacterium]